MIEQSESIKHLAISLAKAHLVITNPTKDKEGVHKAKYATLEACINITRKTLAQNGLSIIQLPIKSETESGLTTMLLHESGEYIKSTYTHKIQGSNPQDLGKLITYLRRYSLMAILNISAAEDDDDADSLINEDKDEYVNNTRQASSEKVASDSQINFALQLLNKFRNHPDLQQTYSDWLNRLQNKKITAKQANDFITKYKGMK